MNLSAPFIARPIATTLLTVAIALAGALGYLRLPVSPLPQVDFPTIAVQATLPGGDPETLATSVAGPLERHLGGIADVGEMTSSSSVGSTRVILQFGLSRNIDGAARDVQAAINAARADLPASLRANPTYHKINPADAPVLILALTSRTLSRAQVYDAASNVLQQRLSQLPGIGQVFIGGGALPAVRVELNVPALQKYGIGLEDVRAALASANAHSPKGMVQDERTRWQIRTNDQAGTAADYRPLVIAYRGGRPVRLSDVAEVLDSVEDTRNTGLYNDQGAVLAVLFRQPGANIISTVDGVVALLPHLREELPPSIEIHPAADRTVTIRGALADTQRTLLIAVGLVIGVVFLFLRDWRAALVPAVAVPVSILGAFGGMYLLGFSLDNLSLMALTIATGFVVDDAIVVLENVERHMELGLPRGEAARRGAGEVGFTVVSISLSLVAVFLPILLMGGLVGRLFREFALTLTLAILVSMAVSLTTTPMMCALLLRPREAARPGRGRGMRFYARSLRWALRHGGTAMAGLALAVVANVWLIGIIPKGFFPQEDTGRLVGRVQADQATSFQSMDRKLRRLARIVGGDPAVESVVGFTGASGPGGATNTASLFVSLKPLDRRDASADQVIARLRPRAVRVAGAQMFLQAVQDIRAGGRQSNAQDEYTLQSDDAAALYAFAPRLLRALRGSPVLADLSSDQQQGGPEVDIAYDRDTLFRLGLTPVQADNALYDAFGQRQVSTIFKEQNQYHVIMEAAPRFTQDPRTLGQLYVSTAAAPPGGSATTGAPAGTVTGAGAAGAVTGGNARNVFQNGIAQTGRSGVSAGAAVSTSAETMTPLAAFTTIRGGHTPLAVNHQGGFVASTLSFNLAPGHSLGEAGAAIEAAMAGLHPPPGLVGTFSGTAAAFRQNQGDEALLVVAALVAVYIVLGMLYESMVHPVTILSTLPSAGVGAVLALLLFRIEFSLIAMIGLILLIGIVKKNAILMIDFALQAERAGASPEAAIYQAGLKRVRPILMTTMAALFGAIPLAFAFGEGSEIRRPLGVAIVGGLIVSQALTLYTTPVLYLWLDRLRLRGRRMIGWA